MAKLSTVSPGLCPVMQQLLGPLASHAGRFPTYLGSCKGDRPLTRFPILASVMHRDCLAGDSGNWRQRAT